MLPYEDSTTLLPQIEHLWLFKDIAGWRTVWSAHGALMSLSSSRDRHIFSATCLFVICHWLSLTR